MKYKFSQQQIIGINYYYSKLVDSTFDEDDVRLLLIHLREFLLNNDNVDARGTSTTPAFSWNRGIASLIPSAIDTNFMTESPN